jgi:trk system potassium uptake protein TrkH
VRPSVPHAGRHAQTFAAALAALILGGAALLASPWSSESGDSTPPVDALFTAVSAASVTGLVTVDTGTHWNRLGEAVILILIQAGGLGFMVGASIILQALRRGTTRLSDVLLIKEGAPTLSLREAATLSRHIVVFTFAAEAIGAAVLTLRFRQDMPLPDAIWFGVFHAVSAFCNAGFDLQGSFVSLAPYRESLVVNGASCCLSRRVPSPTSCSRTSRPAAVGAGSRSIRNSS